MLQNILNKVCYYNTPNARGEAFSPFAAVPLQRASSGRTSRTSAASCSPTASGCPAARPSSSSPSSTSSTSTPSPSSSSRRGPTGTPAATQQQGRAAAPHPAQGRALLPVRRGHPVHHPQAPQGPHLPRGLQAQGRRRLPREVQPLQQLRHLRAQLDRRSPHRLAEGGNRQVRRVHQRLHQQPLPHWIQHPERVTSLP